MAVVRDGTSMVATIAGQGVRGSLAGGLVGEWIMLLPRACRRFPLISYCIRCWLLTPCHRKLVDSVSLSISVVCIHDC